LPGPATGELCELGELIVDISAAEKEYRDIYKKTKERICRYDDGNISRRVIDIVFGGSTEYSLIKCENKKTRVLFYPGPMDCSEITEAFLALVNELDYEKYDVSIFYYGNNIENMKRISPKARIFMRCGSPSYTLTEHHKMLSVKKNEFHENDGTTVINNAFENEIIRCFGNAAFDYVIDFSGNETDISLLLSAASGAIKVTWDHSIERDKLFEKL
jgi:CDP-glycerol glycerophosphotransferase